MLFSAPSQKNERYTHTLHTINRFINHIFFIMMNLRKPTTQLAKGTFFSLLLTTCAFTACNNEEAFDMPGAGKLSINVGVNHPTSRSRITDATLPDGDTGAIGVI